MRFNPDENLTDLTYVCLFFTECYGIDTLDLF